MAGRATQHRTGKPWDFQLERYASGETITDDGHRVSWRSVVGLNRNLNVEPVLLQDGKLIAEMTDNFPAEVFVIRVELCTDLTDEGNDGDAKSEAQVLSGALAAP